jgi:hypothetical protein
MIDMVALNFVVIPSAYIPTTKGTTIPFSILIFSGTPPYSYYWTVEDPYGNLTVLGTNATYDITFTKVGEWTVGCTVIDSSPDAKGGGTNVYVDCTPYGFPYIFYQWEFYLMEKEYIMQCPSCGEIDNIMFIYGYPTIGYYHAICMLCSYDGSMGDYYDETDWIIIGDWW